MSDSWDLLVIGWAGPALDGTAPVCTHEWTHGTRMHYGKKAASVMLRAVLVTTGTLP